MIHLRFSIDMEAEIIKITQKQHLNRVHFLVQLVRHALSHQPNSIGIWSKKDRLELCQDGQEFNPEEWSLLKTLTTRDNQDHLQSSLTQLEGKHGVAILSLLMNFSFVQIITRSEMLHAENGAIRFETSQAAEPEAISGYRIIIGRKNASPGEELRELKFYGSGSTTPIYFNDRQINEPIHFPNQILVTQFQNSVGSGAVGIPEDEDLCTITYYKSGIRLGMKRFLPPNGVVYHGYWNSGLLNFESDYQESIQNGDRFLQHFSRVLYREIPAHFNGLPLDRKIRVKKLLFGLSHKDWPKHFGNIPLFHSGKQPCSLSYKDLIVLDNHYLGVPFQTGTARNGPPGFPLLHPEDIIFLRDEQNLNLKQIRGIRKWKTRNFKPSMKQGTPVPEEELTPDQSRFRRDLNGLNPFCIFYFTPHQSYSTTDMKGSRQVYLQIQHPQVQEALQLYRKRPETVSLIKYQLLGLL